MTGENNAAVKKNDLLHGGVLKGLLLFAAPLIAGNLLSQFYNVVDSIVVGRFVGSDALGAVGSSFSVQMIINSLFAGLGTGSSVLVSQFKGAGRRDDIRNTIGLTFVLALALGTALTVVGMLISRPVLALMNTPDNILDDATTYLSIVFLGSVGHMSYFMGNAILRGLGDSRTPFTALAFCTALNIILDLIFVLVFHWDVAGVAWATIISQAISGVMVVTRILKYDGGLNLVKENFKLRAELIKRIAGIGVPTAAQMILNSSGMLVVQSFINGFGSDIVASNTVMQKIDGFIIQPMMGMGMAMTAFTGQNLGAGLPERVKEATKKGALVIGCFALCLGIPLFFFGEYAAAAFTDNTNVISLTAQGLRVLSFFYMFMAWNNWFTGVVRGAGAMTIPMLITLFTVLIRIPLSYLLAVRADNYMGIYYAMNAVNVLSVALISSYYLFGKWRGKSVTR